ncbi:MAG: hypothetical protein P8045_15415 [Candidatus Thiodiazotropha sp.]
MTYRFSEAVTMVRAACLLLCICATAVGAADNDASIRDSAVRQYPDQAAAVSETVQRADQAGVPADTLTRILSRSSQAGVPASDFIHILNNLSQAGETGLPLAPFSEKVMEGLAKEVAPALIVQVLDKKLATYREAQRIVAESTAQAKPDARAVVAVALSFERGISPQGMQALLTEQGYEPAPVGHAAQALADLVSMGFNEGEGVAIVRAGLDAGYLQKGGATLTQIVAQAQKLGFGNDAIAQRMVTALNRGTPMAEISLELHGGNRRGGNRGGNDGWGHGGAQSGGAGGHGNGGGRHAN